MDLRDQNRKYIPAAARVVKQVNTLDLKSNISKGLQVRFLPRVPSHLDDLLERSEGRILPHELLSRRGP